jgi:septal ring factor EnvC (AmiA/AmiB activator)
MTMEGIEGFGDRQRVDRWLEEGQYLVGRLIPAYLDDRERVRGRLETIEADNERLRLELADSRREIAELRADLDAHRTERTRVAESFHAIVEHLTALQAPVTDVSSRLHAVHPVAAETKV